MSSEIFRDRTEGASARRQDLLRRRRDEFVMMPHAIRRVYVARRARSGAAIAVWLTGVALVATMLSPKLATFLTRGMPGINPAVLSTGVIAMWVLGVVAYFVARARCEHHFAVEISKTVLPGQDLDHDVERLANERPDDVGRAMAHKLEVRSSAWPVAALAMLLPATALYIYYGVKAGGWPSIAVYEAALAAQSKKLALIGGFGTLAAIFVTRRSLRLPVVAPVAAGVTLLGTGVAMAVKPWLVLIAIVGLSVAYVAFRLKRERAQLETDDPAAGAEIFTWKGFWQSTRATIATVNAKLPRRPKQIAMIALGMAVIALFLFRGHKAPAAPPTIVAQAPTIAPKELITTNSGASFKVSPTGDGAFKVDLTIVDDKGIDITFPGIGFVPRGWTARLAAQQLGPMLSDSMSASMVAPGGFVTIYGTSETSFSVSACDEEAKPFTLHVNAPAGTYSLRVTPVLEPAGC